MKRNNYNKKSKRITKSMMKSTRNGSRNMMSTKKIKTPENQNPKRLKTMMRMIQKQRKRKETKRRRRNLISLGKRTKRTRKAAKRKRKKTRKMPTKRKERAKAKNDTTLQTYFHQILIAKTNLQFIPKSRYNNRNYHLINTSNLYLKIIFKQKVIYCELNVLSQYFLIKSLGKLCDMTSSVSLIIIPTQMSMKEAARAKRNTLQIYATLEKYDWYKRTIATVPKLYQHDFLFYNDTVQERHQRNKKQIKKIIGALKTNQLSPQMLEFNTSNTFYPSYVLHHHYANFTKLSFELAEGNSTLASLVPKFRDFSLIGAIFDKTINVQFKRQTQVSLENGLIKMSPDTYFYSFKTSPYINLCCFQLKQENKNLYVYVKLRDENSQFCKDIQVRDIGATISPDYLNIGYRFNNVKPLFVIQSHSGKFFRNALSEDSVSELGFSLQDLAQSLHITVQYTKMRLQFSTLEKSKNQRPIGQYQAVVSRVTDGFTTLFGLSYLRQRLITMPQIASFMRFYLPFMHQVILERLIDLRECCGGYGFLQMSGHPAFLQRASIRSAQHAITIVPQDKQVMKRIHYYSNDDDRQLTYVSQLSDRGDSLSDIFGFFVIICIRMRKNRQNMTPRQYMKQFLRQACIQMMYSSSYFDSVDQSNPSENLLPYILVKYVIQFSQFLNWEDLKGKYNPQQLHERLKNLKTKLLHKIAPEIPKLGQILEVGFLRNVIVGQQNSEQFYKKVMEVSQNNKRNSPEYKKDILKNLVEVIKTQRARL